MLRTRQMSHLSRHLAKLTSTLELPEDVSLVIDIDPVICREIGRRKALPAGNTRPV